MPPVLLVAIEKSREADVRLKLPPVEDESVTITLVAFAVSASAADPDLIVKLIAGEVSATVVSVV